MHPTSRKSLRDALTACDLILDRTAGRTFEEYLADPFFRGGVERQFEIVGEALRRIERKDPVAAGAIPNCRDVIDFRNVLAHGYDTVHHEEVWQYIHTDLLQLRDQVATLFVQGSQDGGG
jgi:uncharacterized protein with HEPN domain